MEGEDWEFFFFEVLEVIIVDCFIGVCIQGIVGNNFFFYICDFDFSVWLLVVSEVVGGFIVFDDFGDLYGKFFQYFFDFEVYWEWFVLLFVICISVLMSKMYCCIENYYLIFGVEYEQKDGLLIDEYFGKMGFLVCYFMLWGSVVLLVFYFCGDLLNDYMNFQFIGMISMMEMFQKIYWLEIYNVNFEVVSIYWLMLEQQDYLVIKIVYDCEEWSWFVIEQGQYVLDYFMKLYGEFFERWVVGCFVDLLVFVG